MTKYLALTTIFFSLVLGFQNCGQPGSLQSGIDAAEAGTIASDSGLIGGGGSQSPPKSQSPTPPSDGLALPALAAMEVLAQPTLSTASNGTMIRVEGLNLLIDLKSGEITEINQNREPEDKPKHCLTPNDLSILTSIFASGRLCESEQGSKSGMMCAMVYKMPYARLHSLGGEAIDLGEARSSCDRGPDLCGANQDLLKAFIANLLSHLQEKVCAD
ncbi:MAG: hypothetical protein JNM39_15090 [Bdellovibrionaceae bacterium]|nr:hypothetical protein [Pseudobdellovibrionaceae bacterium]